MQYARSRNRGRRRLIYSDVILISLTRSARHFEGDVDNVCESSYCKWHSPTLAKHSAHYNGVVNCGALLPLPSPIGLQKLSTLRNPRVSKTIYIIYCSERRYPSHVQNDDPEIPRDPYCCNKFQNCIDMDWHSRSREENWKHVWNIVKNEFKGLGIPQSSVSVLYIQLLTLDIDLSIRIPSNNGRHDPNMYVKVGKK